MRLIAHRGNMAGPDREFENTPEYLLAALDKGFDVELDAWIKDGLAYFGHDGPEHFVDGNHEIWHHKDRIWLHAKDLETLTLFSFRGWNVFWNDKDDYALTNRGQIWANYGCKGNPNTVHMLRKGEVAPADCWGICSDWIGGYR